MSDFVWRVSWRSNWNGKNIKRVSYFEFYGDAKYKVDLLRDGGSCQDIEIKRFRLKEVDFEYV